MMNKYPGNKPPHPIKCQPTPIAGMIGTCIGACAVIVGIFAVLLLPVFEAGNWITRKLLGKEEKHG